MCKIKVSETEPDRSTFNIQNCVSALLAQIKRYFQTCEGFVQLEIFH